MQIIIQFERWVDLMNFTLMQDAIDCPACGVVTRVNDAPESKIPLFNDQKRPILST